MQSRSRAVTQPHAAREEHAHQLEASLWSKVYVVPAVSVSFGLTPVQPVTS